MKLPKNNYELTEIFRNARTPKVSEFNGEYLVDMLTILPSLKRFSHRKIFYVENDKILGYNTIFTNKIWGHFFLEEGICEGSELYSSAAQGVGLSNGVKVVIINYDRVENTFISNRIRDYIRCVEKNTIYIGRFNYLFIGRPRFLGYFSLSKIK